jgi:hypothetical protein
MYNILFAWKTWETTYEPLGLIIQDAPVSCSECASNNVLLDSLEAVYKTRTNQKEKRLYGKPSKTHKPSKVIHFESLYRFHVPMRKQSNLMKEWRYKMSSLRKDRNGTNGRILVIH